jgi:hypothetical protein
MVWLRSVCSGYAMFSLNPADHRSGGAPAPGAAPPLPPGSPAGTRAVPV